MPFTLAHPAIVLPFLRINKRYFSPTALVAGSMAPDLDYFVRMDTRGQQDHSLEALIFIDFPAAIIMAILFHTLVKKNLLDNAPEFFQSRYDALRQFDFVAFIRSYPLSFLFGIALGEAAHVFWDSFTHHGGFFVTHLSFYNYFVPFQGVRYPMFYALQHVSTLIGLIVILVYIFFMPVNKAAEIRKPGYAYWLAVVIFSTIFVCIRYALTSTQLTMENLALTVMTAACISMIAAGMIRFRPVTN